MLRTQRELPHVVLSLRVPTPQFNHMDFLYAENAREMVYDPLLRVMGDYS